MENNNKYFVPEISDFHIGYEYEQGLVDSNWFTTGWEKRIIDEKSNLKLIKEHPSLHRVPYLTKEQLEAEGWHSPEVYRDGGTLVYKKDKYEITFMGENKISPSTEIVFTELFEMMDKITRHILFKGKCKDINTFRRICKLLEI